MNGANNDLTLPATAFARVTGPGAAFNITGLTGGEDGRVVFLYNTTAQNMTLNHENAGSSASNRLHMHDAADIVTTGEGMVALVYDATLSRWLPLSQLL
mgnify:FL=1